jgi:hypothetical protein
MFLQVPYCSTGAFLGVLCVVRPQWRFKRGGAGVVLPAVGMLVGVVEMTKYGLGVPNYIGTRLALEFSLQFLS